MADNKELSKVISSLTDAIKILNTYTADEDEEVIDIVDDVPAEGKDEMIEIIDDEEKISDEKESDEEEIEETEKVENKEEVEEGLIGTALATGTLSGAAHAVGKHVVGKLLDKKSDVKESIGDELDKYQEWVDYDMEHYGRISARTNALVRRAGLEIVKDDHGDYEVIAKEVEGEPIQEAAISGENAKDVANSIVAFFRDNNKGDPEKVELAQNIINAVPPEAIDDCIDKFEVAYGEKEISPEHKEEFKKAGIDASGFEKFGEMLDNLLDNPDKNKAGKAIILTIMGIVAIIEPTPIGEIVTGVLAMLPADKFLKIVFNISFPITSIVRWFMKKKKADSIASEADAELEESLLGKAAALGGAALAGGAAAGVTDAVTSKLLNKHNTESDSEHIEEVEEEIIDEKCEKCDEKCNEECCKDDSCKDDEIEEDLLNPLSGPLKAVGSVVSGIGNAVGNVVSGIGNAVGNLGEGKDCEECEDDDEVDEGLLGTLGTALGAGALAGGAAGLAHGITSKILSSDDPEEAEGRMDKKDKTLNEAALHDFEDRFDFYLSMRIAEDIFYRDAYILIEPVEEAFDLGVEIIYVDEDQMIHLYNEATDEDTYEHYVENEYDVDSQIRTILQSYLTSELDDIAIVKVVKSRYYR